MKTNHVINYQDPNKEFNVDLNFWEVNPQLKLIKEFKALYDLDNSDDKSYSSKQMWFIFFMCESDMEINKFATMDPEKRIDILKDTFFKDIDENDEYLNDAIDIYPEICMTLEERALADAYLSVRRLHKFLRNVRYTEDNVSKITSALKNLKVVYSDLEEAKDNLLKKKESDDKSKHKKTLSDKKLI